MESKSLEDFIVVIKQIIPAGLCDAVIQEYNNSNLWEDAQDRTDNGEASKKYKRDCQVIFTSNVNNLKLNPNRVDTDNSLFLIVSTCLKRYSALFPYCSVSQDTGYDLLKYNEKGYYKEHTDAFIGYHREIACSLLLNDDFDGGEFAFFNQSLKYNLQKGDAIMFPSNFMYPHEVMEITKGTRYAIITWFK